MAATDAREGESRRMERATTLSACGTAAKRDVAALVPCQPVSYTLSGHDT